MGDSDSIRVAVVENQQLIQDLLTVIFQEAGEIELAGFARTEEEAKELVRHHKPDIVIVDIHSPGIDGIKEIKMIKQYSPQTKIIMLGAKPDERLIFRGIQAGAETFLLTDMSNEQFINAIKEVYHGGHVISGAAAKAIVSCMKEISLDKKEYLGKRLNDSGYNLTNRELDIAYLVMEGRSNAEISQILSLEEGTVKNYISEIYSKLGIRKRPKAISFLRSLIEEEVMIES
ncbi:DNA-binding response regulator [Compostibacillus humi]|uniref:DNA-binding response regulator n=1 Tax=Compostibacillus humi TaxID=1245525 RepID=A0A8J2XEV2_9BACI|nr:response regulator transcription factor [Compostibacillus humi]GFZ80004.1 DNA-binding response regulator [Compostibacillus humi]